MIKKISIFLILSVYIFLTAGNVHSQEENKPKCLPIDADELQKFYEDDSYRFDKMDIFDIRPYSMAIDGKRIPLTKLITRDMFKVKYIDKVTQWKGKDIYLMGNDTESTKDFCTDMLKKIILLKIFTI